MDLVHKLFYFEEDRPLHEISRSLDDFGPGPSMVLRSSSVDDEASIIVRSMISLGTDHEGYEAFSIAGDCTIDSSENYHGAKVVGWICADGTAGLSIFPRPHNFGPEEDDNLQLELEA